MLSNVLISVKSNFDDWKCPAQQSFIPQEITYFLKNPYFSLQWPFYISVRQYTWLCLIYRRNSCPFIGWRCLQGVK